MYNEMLRSGKASKSGGGQDAAAVGAGAGAMAAPVSGWAAARLAVQTNAKIVIANADASMAGFALGEPEQRPVLAGALVDKQLIKQQRTC
jgi:hypothetical protein